MQSRCGAFNPQATRQITFLQIAALNAAMHCRPDAQQAGVNFFRTAPGSFSSISAAMLSCWFSQSRSNSSPLLNG